MASTREIIRVEGLSDLETALKELPKATARNVLLRVLKERAEPVREAGEALAPFKTGKLKESYSVSTRLSRSQKRKQKKDDNKSAVEVYVGPAPSTKSITTEFGTVHAPAKPHLRPAWDGTNRGVLDGITKDLAEEIEKARKRLARKAEREAAKMKA